MGCQISCFSFISCSFFSWCTKFTILHSCLCSWTLTIIGRLGLMPNPMHFKSTTSPSSMHSSNCLWQINEPEPDRNLIGFLTQYCPASARSGSPFGLSWGRSAAWSQRPWSASPAGSFTRFTRERLWSPRCGFKGRGSNNAIFLKKNLQSFVFGCFLTSCLLISFHVFFQSKGVLQNQGEGARLRGAVWIRATQARPLIAVRWTNCAFRRLAQEWKEKATATSFSW